MRINRAKTISHLFTTMLAVQALCAVAAACLVSTDFQCVPVGDSFEYDEASNLGEIVDGVWEGYIKVAVTGCTVPSSREAAPMEQGADSIFGPVERTCTALADINTFTIVDGNPVWNKILGADSIVNKCTTDVPDGETCFGAGYGS